MYIVAAARRPRCRRAAFLCSSARDGGGHGATVADLSPPLPAFTSAAQHPARLPVFIFIPKPRGKRLT